MKYVYEALHCLRFGGLHYRNTMRLYSGGFLHIYRQTNRLNHQHPPPNTNKHQIRLSDFGVAVTALAGGVSPKEAMKGLSFSLAPEMRHAHGSNGGPRNRFGLAADWCVVCFYVVFPTRPGTCDAQSNQINPDQPENPTHHKTTPTTTTAGPSAWPPI